MIELTNLKEEEKNSRMCISESTRAEQPEHHLNKIKKDTYSVKCSKWTELS